MTTITPNDFVQLHLDFVQLHLDFVQLHLDFVQLHVSIGGSSCTKS